MTDRHLVIVGGGLAGLSAGCYALRNGYRVTIVEHNMALGGVCTSWQRGPYTIDGCIHWLTGGAFSRIYEELEIFPSVAVRPLSTWVTYRDARGELEVPLTRDLDALVARLAKESPADEPELMRLRRSTEELVAMAPPLDAPELSTLRERLHALWDMRDVAGSLVHFRKPIGEWASSHLSSPRLRRLFVQTLGETTPTFFLCMVLGYLERGYLSRPVGGTAAFRDALERTYRTRGGEAILNATVDGVLVDGDRARGVRLDDGTAIRADAVISTASAPETVLRLLGGHYDAHATRERLARWPLVDPIVLASFGVARPYAEVPSLLLIDNVPSFDVGGRVNDHLYVRVCNDDPSFAPRGHTVVQTMVPTSYDFWSDRGTAYQREKEVAAEVILSRLEPHFPNIRSDLQVTDVATPLTYYRMARSWRGAYEGYKPTGASFFGHVDKTLSGLHRFYMAGQWVEPGGGVPIALMSGRQVVQLLCDEDARPFVPTPPAPPRGPSRVVR